MATPSVRLTYDDYVRFPDGERWELIDGVAYIVASPNRRHQEVLGRLFLIVANHVEAHRGGHVYTAPFDTVLTEADVVQPDLVYVSDADADVLTDANIWGTPTWPVEVLSPSQPERDRELKRQAYERTRVPEYWIVDPMHDRVLVYRLVGDRYAEPSTYAPPDVVEPASVPGLGIDLGYVLRRP